jgi:hypothetical protein
MHEPQVLATGFCWPAACFSIAWLFYNRLWSKAALWIGVLLACRYLHALVDVAASGRVPMAVVLAAGYAALVVVPGLLGHRWLEQRLLDEGYEPHNTAAAPLAG